MAYAQSASLVAYLFQAHGTQSLQILIEEMSQGIELDVALVRATGLTPQELDVAWRGRTLSIPLWLRSISIDGTLLALVGCDSAWFISEIQAVSKGQSHMVKKNVSIEISPRDVHLGRSMRSESCPTTAPYSFRCWSKQQWQDHILDGIDTAFERTQPYRRHHQTLSPPTGCARKDGHKLGTLAPNLTVGRNRMILDEPPNPSKPVELVDRFYAEMDVVLVESWRESRFQHC